MAHKRKYDIVRRNFSYQSQPMSNLYGITCRTKKAKVWVKKNLNTENWQWLGNTLWIDIRYTHQITSAIRSEFN